MNPTLNILKTKQALALEKIYARIPKIQCQRKCQNACGLIGGSPAEQSLVQSLTAGMRLGSVQIFPATKHPRCAFLTAEDGDCSIYGLRPLMCRLFGVIHDLQCRHGCIPERWLDHSEVQEIIREVQNV